MSIKKFEEQPSYINDFSNALLDGFYLRKGETFNDAIARASEAFCYGDYQLAQRIYEAAHKGWFMFASPVLSNAPVGKWTQKVPDCEWKDFEVNPLHKSVSKAYWDGEHSSAMPISCFALEVPDSIKGQMEANVELAALSVAGGGVGLHNSIRATTDKAPGPIPYMKTMDAIIGYYKQGKTRRGACAYYMDVSHPDIMEHIKFRIPSGGDSARKADNRVQFHHAVNVTDKFTQAVLNDDDFELICPHTKEVKDVVKARMIWEEILEARALQGEPYLFKIDQANRTLPQTQKDKGLKIQGSNICIEVSLPTNEERTFVCCLSSLNLAKFDEWKSTNLVEDLTRFLDNVLQYFIDNAPTELKKAVYSAKMERAIGIGTLSWHYYLQSKGIPMEGGGFGSAIQETHKIYKLIKEKALLESKKLAVERGEPSDMIGSGLRNSALMAVAPNSNNAVILGESPSIEPVSGNVYSHSTRAGTFTVKNPHLTAKLKQYATKLGIAEDKVTSWVNDQETFVAKDNGSVQNLEFMGAEDKLLFKTGAEIDQHWIIEQSDARAQYICQSQSLNTFYPAGCDRAYFNSVHLKFLVAPFSKSMYYARMERGINADVAKEIERKAITDWMPEVGEECAACSG